MTATAHVNGTGASLGFVTLGINGATASLNAAFSMSLNAQPPVNASEPAGRLTLDQLNNTPLSSLVSTQLTSTAPTTLALQIHTPLSSSATNISFNWPDITNPTNVTSSLSSDPTLAQLSKLQDISSDSFSSGIDMVTGAGIAGEHEHQQPEHFPEEAAAIERIDRQRGEFSAVFLRQFLEPDGPGSQRFGNSDFAVPEQRPVAELAQDDPQFDGFGRRQRQRHHLHAVVRQDDFNLRPAVAEPGVGINLNVTSTLNFSCDVAVHLQFGVDGSTGTFFIVANGQPAVTLTPTLSATLNGSASLGFLSINITNGTVSGNGTGSITLNDPQTDSPPRRASLPPANWLRRIFRRC